jgi:DASS family divalent anion:Na+ symporter
VSEQPRSDATTPPTSASAGTLPPLAAQPPDETPVTAPSDGDREPVRTTLMRWLVPPAVGAAIYLIPAPEAVEPQGWTLLAIFVATIVAIIAKPLPMGAIAFVGLTVATVLEVFALDEALSGFSNTVIWLIVIAFLISRAVIKTGLGTRIAYLFVRLLGRKTLGLAYGLAATDLVIAPATPSNTARAGGIVFPVARSLASAYGSEPNEGSERIGSFLMASVFQVNAVTSAMFLTAMAANPLVVELASFEGIEITWGQWALAASVPGLLALLTIPFVMFKLTKPTITETPAATEIATQKLAELGSLKRMETITLAVFALLIGLWIFGENAFGIGATLAAMIGLGVLLLTTVLTWDDVKREHAAWDTLVWFAVLVTMASFLNEYGVIAWISSSIEGVTGGMGWPMALTILVLSYLYIHYFFASNTAHVTALFPTFLIAALATGAPPLLAAFLLAFASNLMGGLTQYATGPAPVLFGAGYNSLPKWWQYGFVASVINVLIFGVIGALWMGLVGIY